MSNSNQDSSSLSSGGARPRLTAPALRRGLDILELFLDAPDGLGVPDITKALPIPRASAHELVQTLNERGYLRKLADTQGRFTLGPRVFQLGGAYERTLDLVEAGRRAAKSVANRCGETVQVVVQDGRFVVYIVRIDSKHTLRLVSDVGSRLPAHCTAGGKALLSYLGSEELHALFPDDNALSQMTERSIGDRSRLLSELALTKSRGWAEEYCESNPDVACVAAPVLNPVGECVAAVSISVPTVRWRDEDKDHLVASAIEGARELSESLGASI